MDHFGRRAALACLLLLSATLPACAAEAKSEEKKEAETKAKSEPSGCPKKDEPASPVATLAAYCGKCPGIGWDCCAGGPAAPLQAVIATVPDPTFANLGSVTDSTFDALRLAMQKAGYVPFAVAPHGWPAQLCEKQPLNGAAGWWLFSREGKRPGYVMIFLVAEDPVTGIRRNQLRDAFLQVAAISQQWAGGSRVPIRVLGPYFSGGGRSLADELQRSSVHEFAVSGTASNPGLAKTFEGLRWHQLAAVDPLEQAIGFITQEYGVRRDSIAVLSEAHTPYGAKSSSGVKTIYLPRDLSALRRAYSQEKELYRRMFPSGRLPQLALSVPLADPKEQAHIPVYFDQTMPKAQETTLVALARRLKMERTQFLGIHTTDRLDALFLARFMTEESANVRIFLVGSDTLFDVGNARGSLTGTLTFSSYPIGESSQDRMPLASDVAAGFSYALQRILETPAGARDPDRCDPLPLYVSVLGRGGEWPIRVLSGTSPVPPGTPPPWPYLAFVFATLVTVGIPLRRFLAPEGSKVLRRLSPYTVPLGLEPQEGEPERVRWIHVFLGLVVLALAPVLSLPVFHEGASAARLLTLTNAVNPVLYCFCLVLSALAIVWMRIRSRYLDNYSFAPMLAPGDDQEQRESVDLQSAVFTPSKVLTGLIRKSWHCWWWWLCLGLAGAATLVYDVLPRSIEPGHGRWIFWAFSLAGVLIYGSVVYQLGRFYFLWQALFDVLRTLEAHPIRNAFTRLPDRVSWTRIWSLRGLRPSFISLQMTADYLSVLSGRKIGREQEMNDTSRAASKLLAQLYEGGFPEKADVVKNIHEIHAEVLALGAELNTCLVARWRQSRLEGWRASKDQAAWKKEDAATWPLDRVAGRRNTSVQWNDTAMLAEEFLAMLYSAYIRHVFLHLRNMIGGVTVACSLLFLACAVYPVQPQRSIMNAITFLFALFATTVLVSFWQMDRDPLLSRLSDTQAGKLDAGFGKRILQFGVLPTLTYLLSHVPELSGLMLRIVEIIPGMPK